MATSKDDAETEIDVIQGSNEALTEESGNRTNNDWLGVGRRSLLKAVSAGTALTVSGGIATADEQHDDDGDGTDGPTGAEIEVVAPHATFPGDVAAAFGVTYEDGAEDSAFLQDASTVVIVRASLEPGGAGGWHADKGPAIPVVVEGEVDIVFEDDEGGCITRTYAAGEAGIATGRYADRVANASDTEPAIAYVIFFGVPDGESPSEPTEPPDC